MSGESLPTRRFIRKTQLGPNEYRKNFRQIDDDVIAMITSTEADAVSPMMSKIYLRMLKAPAKYWEETGVLRFEAEVREGKLITAWVVLCELLNVSSATANKALKWMHKSEIIGYFSGKNGVGLRVFLNHASSSVGTKRASAEKKILPFSPALSGEAPASTNEAGFNGDIHVSEILDLDKNTSAPQDGADNDARGKLSSDQKHRHPKDIEIPSARTRIDISHAQEPAPFSLDEIVMRLKSELEPALRTAAVRAAAREHEQTREWLENRGLPKAARVAQREAFNVLRSQGVFKDLGRRAQTDLLVGQHNNASPKPKPPLTDRIKEVADICVSMLESHSQAIDVTLAEISAGAGGYLMADDVPKVRELAESLARQMIQKE
jgi:hypothetical protein